MVRNAVFAPTGRRIDAVMDSGGFFSPGEEGIVVPIRALKVSHERDSVIPPFFRAEVRGIPPMADRDYKWPSNDAWRARKDALFGRPSGASTERL
ncbi:hypothetical protein [Methylobacterium sp. Leaf399]|uniref:hypothetical protein n=1 Tax=Methylobacterium sp. Leaf399 TaxID=1736364 RepID=UPI0012E3F136|nr:hypothetical protein [Methylobacterium sp. Leaf399]